ncbi:MAG: ribonuclease E/G [Clostridiales bacterium]|jgi:ribonuclease G|nr:ribonuclease E/G [Clostridiales bacterium]
MKRLLIDVSGGLQRAALTDGDTLTEIVIDRDENGSIVGQIILGTVQNILPSQFAFIEIGSEKNAFMNLYAGHRLKPGQPVLVQVYKDASGAKGANVGQKLHFNGRHVIIYGSARTESGVSQKITDAAERARLRKIIRETLPGGYGAIARTNSEGQDEGVIKQEILALVELHKNVTERAGYLRPPAVAHREDRLLNDLFSRDIGEIWVNERGKYDEISGWIKTSAPEMGNRLFFYSEAEDAPSLFNAYGVESQIRKALEKRVWLPCGGFVTFEQTEACVVADVNTGKFAGKKNYRDTVLRANLEAAECIAEQLRLRNLSGMIIVDFIDMYAEDDRKALLKTFEEHLRKDRIKTNLVGGMTELGLVQVTRRKTRESLSRLMERDCPECGGTGKAPRNE